MSTALAPPPLQSPIVERDGLMTKVFAQWLRSVVDRAQSSPAAVSTAAVHLTGQTAAIDLSTLIASASGRYRVSYRVRVTAADGISSSVQVVIKTIEGGIVCSYADAAYTGDSPNGPFSGSFLLDVDAASPVAFTVAYASHTPGKMTYELDLVTEALS